MPSSCKKFQERLLQGTGPGPGASDEHLLGCAACGEWAARQQRVARALEGLERRGVPADLGRSLPSLLLTHGSAPAAAPEASVALDAIGNLSRPQAPEALETALRAQIEGDAEDARVGKLLQGLGRQRAPEVLERLVQEELAAPEKARAQRFAGDLDRLSTPSKLRSRVLESMQGAPTRVGRRAPIALAGLAAAAALLLTLGPRLIWQGGAASPLDGFPFQVRAVASIDELSPMARSMVAFQPLTGATERADGSAFSGAGSGGF